MRLITTLCLLLCCAAASAADIVYERSFKVPSFPNLPGNVNTLLWSSGPIAVRPETGGLLLRGHGNRDDVIELTIPTVDGATATKSGEWFDITAGLIAAENAKYGAQFHLKAMHVTDDDKVLGVLSRWYNVSYVNHAPFFRGDLSLGGHKGPWNGGFHSLAQGQYLTPLSPQLRKHFKRRWGGGATIGQGAGQTNWGPSLYVFDFPNEDFPANGVFSSTKVITWPSPGVAGNTTSQYPGYYWSWRIDSIHSLPGEVIWLGCKGLGESGPNAPKNAAGDTPSGWYGAPTMEFTKPDGTKITVVDEVRPAKGGHSDSYQRTMWRCSNASIIAGKPVITETSLDAHCTGKPFEICGAYHGGKLYVLDQRADGDKPVIRVFGVK